MSTYTFPANSSNPVYATTFGHKIEVPDEYGKPISGQRDGYVIYVTCEHGVYEHKVTKRNPEMMKNKALFIKRRARALGGNDKR